MMGAGALIVPTADMFVKLLSETLSTGMIAWVRFLIQAVGIWLFLAWQRKSLERPAYAHLLLALLVSLAALFFFWGLRFLPLANNVMLFFAQPLLLVVISGLFLGEPATRTKIGVVLIGLAGAVIVIRPNWSLYGVAALLPVAAALCIAAYMATMRHLSQTARLGSALTLQFWISVIAGGIYTVLVIVSIPFEIGFFALKMPALHEVSWLLGAGGIGAFVHILVTFALQKADASKLAPLQYMEIIGAVLLGWLVFGDGVDGYTLLGGTMIIGSGIYVFAHERKMARLEANNLI